MGTPDNRFRKIRDLDTLENSRVDSQIIVDGSKSVEERRRYGQFSTPYPLAQEIISYGLSLLDTNDIRFLEPSLGTGTFYSALLHEAEHTCKSITQATGIEIDKSYYDAAKTLWHETGLKILNADFTHCQPDTKYNFVITNPPYVRHHYISQDEKAHLNDLVKQETGIDLSGLSGLYCYFLMLTHKWLAPNAICGWLLPSEFMDVNYGGAVKKYLLNNVHLLKVHRYDPENSKFDDALVSSCVVWFKNEIVNSDYDVEFSYSGTHNKPIQKMVVTKSILRSERKWTRFPKKNVRNYERESTTIGDYFTIKRGLATGDNNFFILSRDKINELGLDMSFFKPILPSPRYLKTDFVESDSVGNPQIEQQYFLLDCGLPEPEIQTEYPKLWEYLRSGIDTTSSKYLCKNRKKWYWQEQRQATAFLCSYMGRGNNGTTPIRFILNLSEAIATNSYLMLYPKKNLQQAISDNPDVVYQIWETLKKINATEIEDEGRVYGGGLKKIEPNELAKVPCDRLCDVCTA